MLENHRNFIEGFESRPLGQSRQIIQNIRSALEQENNKKVNQKYSSHKVKSCVSFCFITWFFLYKFSTRWILSSETNWCWQNKLVEFVFTSVAILVDKKIPVGMHIQNKNAFDLHQTRKTQRKLRNHKYSRVAFFSRNKPSN